VERRACSNASQWVQKLKNERCSNLCECVRRASDSSDESSVELAQQSELGSNAIVSRVNETATVIAKTRLYMGVVGAGKHMRPKCIASETMHRTLS
jgi:hypothetical protein